MQILIVVAWVALWEASSRILALPTFMLPPPSLVAVEFWEHISLIWRHSMATLSEIVIGFGVALIGGVLLAVVLAASKLLNRIFTPLILFLQTTPKSALAPLLVVWVGIGAASKITLVFLMCFFPIFISMTAGLRSVDEESVMLARLSHANRRRFLLKIQFPHSLPQLFSGMKVAITLAVIGAIVAEFIASSEGLGYYMLFGFSSLDTPLVLAIVLAISLMGQILYGLVLLAERRVLHWHVSQRNSGQM